MTEDYNSEIWNEIQSLNDRVSRLESKLDSDLEIETDVQDLTQFLEDIDPDTHNERAVAIGFYLEQIEGKDSFSRSDIMKGYQNARVPLPANMSDVLANCEKKNWMMQVGSDGQAKLRQLGQEGIELVKDEVSEKWD